MPKTLAILYLLYHCNTNDLKRMIDIKEIKHKKVKDIDKNDMDTVQRIALIGTIMKMERTKKN